MYSLQKKAQAIEIASKNVANMQLFVDRLAANNSPLLAKAQATLASDKEILAFLLKSSST
jgi:hypothetical protein